MTATCTGILIYLFSCLETLHLCNLLSEATPDPLETAEPTYFGERSLPELSLSRVTPEEIHRMFEHHRNPDLPTDFD